MGDLLHREDVERKIGISETVQLREEVGDLRVVHGGKIGGEKMTHVPMVGFRRKKTETDHVIRPDSGELFRGREPLVKKGRERREYRW